MSDCRTIGSAHAHSRPRRARRLRRGLPPSRRPPPRQAHRADLLRRSGSAERRARHAGVHGHLRRQARLGAGDGDGLPLGRDRLRRAHAHSRLRPRPLRRPFGEGAWQTCSRRADRVERPLLQPRPGAVRALVVTRCARGRDGGVGDLHARRAPERPGRLPADGQRRRGRGGVRPHLRRGDARGRRSDDRARTPHDHGLKTVFLVNPASANGKTGKRWPQIALAAQAADLHGEAVFSQRPGQLAQLAREAADEGAKLLVVVGGDGTVHEVVNGIAGREGVELALVPRGTGWDFARTHGVPKRLEDALRIAKESEARPFDLGWATYRADGAEASAWFANMASVGMSGAVAAKANGTTKALGAKTSYLLALGAVFARWKNVRLRVAVDDERREALMEDCIVALGRYLAGGMMITPDAAPDDGLFDVLLIGDITKTELVRVMPKIYRGTHLPHPKGEVLRGTTVTIDADEPMPIQLDGEQPGRTL